MHGFVVVLAFIGALVKIDARNPHGHWKQVDTHDGFEVLKQLKPAGFVHSSTIGDYDVYLTRSTWPSGHSLRAGCSYFGELFVREVGDLATRFGWSNGNNLNRIDNNHQYKVEVLVTPPECVSWVSINDNAKFADLPPRYLFWEASCPQQRAICRTWVEEKKSLHIGYFHHAFSAPICEITYDGNEQSTTTNIEILAYNELAEVLPQCQD